MNLAYTKLSPNHSGRRTHSVDRITPHCVVGQISAEGLGDWFAKASTQASSNYGIDKDGRVGLYVAEENRSWCSSSAENDNRAITIECASDTVEPYAFREGVYETLVELCTDICRRYKKKKLLWIADKDAALSYDPADDEMLLTVHRWFAAKSCPGNWLMARMGDLAARVTAALGGTVEENPPRTCDAARVIAVAAAEVGYHEKAGNSALDDNTGNSGGANFTKYARDFDQKYPNWYNGKKQSYAWCDVFVDWCFLTAYGYENALRLLCQPEKSAGAGCTYSLQYYLEKGQFHIDTPQPGDQIFFGTGYGNSTHTGIVEKVEDGYVYTIEGNTGDQVARRRYSLYDSCILGYGRPAYDSITQDDEKAIWDALMTFIGNPYGVAGLMGNLDAESGLKANNLQNSGNSVLGMTDEEFTTTMDAGAYDNFVNDGYGYGLAQWTARPRKAALLARAQERGVSVSDLGMQLGFICHELTEYHDVLETLRNAASVREASDVVLTQYERPADQGPDVKEKRAACGQRLFDKYAGAQAESAAGEPFLVRVSIPDLNIRLGPGLNYARVGVTGKGVFTIVEQTGNWGKLKSGAGWICLDYASRI